MTTAALARTNGFVDLAEQIAQLPATVVHQPATNIDKLLSKAQFVSLVSHMMNGNPRSHFLTVWRDKNGGAGFAKAKSHLDANSHANWTYDTITGKAKHTTSMGVYPKNEANESTWGALDLDAHDSSQRDVAEGWAVRAFTLLLEYPDRYLILSASGRGYHVFILAHEPRPVSEWVRVLKNTADSIGAPIQDGVCEMFPNENTATQPFGKAIRVPGSLNPTTGEVGKIIAHTINPLLDRLAAREAVEEQRENLSLVKEANSYSCTGAQGFSSRSTQKLIEDVLAKYPITRKGTRNGVLTKLVGELFRKFGFALAKEIVRQHYRANEANVRTGEADNLRDFEQAWKLFRKNELARLSESERERFENLKTEAQREAFFLCRSFAKLNSEFPLSRASLADRLSVMPQGAGCLIERLRGLGIIERTAEPKPHRSSALYRWVACPAADAANRASSAATDLCLDNLAEFFQPRRR
jgi:hypothetical protein